MPEKFLYQNHIGFLIIGAVLFEILVIIGQKTEKQVFLSDTNFKRPNLKGQIVIYKLLETSIDC